MARHLVVARWQEDTDWTEFLPGWRLHVVQKDRDLPNRGREPSSFAWAILRDYDAIDPDDEYAFVQGNPFDHCPDLLARLEETITGYTGLGSWEPLTHADGSPHHPGLKVAHHYEAWLDRPFPGPLNFTAGGQFAVTGRELMARPRDFWQRFYDDLMGADESVPYVAERLWAQIFGGPS